MLNIRYKGKYEKESQIMRGELPAGAIKFAEPDDINEVAKKGALISSPLLVITLVIAILRFYPIFRDRGFLSSNAFLMVMLSGCVIMFLFMIIHELIHALCFPLAVEKEIWIYPAGGALFVYCNAPMKKWSWIWMSFAPTFFLGVIPYIVGIVTAGIVTDWLSFELVLVGYIMILSGIGDFLNIYNAVRQVEPGGIILNYGFHSFWKKEEV